MCQTLRLKSKLIARYPGWQLRQVSSEAELPSEAGSVTANLRKHYPAAIIAQSSDRLRGFGIQTL